ncbi:MAG: 6-phosphofructokinase [Phycisphaerales bacterium]|nr:6-phosphofructokinase [Phycisphaerales bacterium]
MAKRIGLITAGGDCPGLNAVIRAVAKPAMREGFEVVGISDGFLGLIEDHMRVLSFNDVSGILAQGGTILGSSNKANPGKFAVGVDKDGKVIMEDRREQCLQLIRREKIETLIVAGGDGSMTIASELAAAAHKAGHSLNVMGVPKTIDNDLVGTEITFGFQTAVSIATDALDRVKTTAASHHRVMVVEVMGRNAGWIALHSGVASGADVILIPEIPFDFEAISDCVRVRSRHGKRYSIVCVAEGAKPKGGQIFVSKVDPTSPDPIRLGGVGKAVADEVEKRTGIESRYVVLGHVQRGGSPVADDRVLSTLLGERAISMVLEGKRDRMAAVQHGRLTDVDINLPCGKQRTVPLDDPLVRAAKEVETHFGD